jgi:hypothetical protein
MILCQLRVDRGGGGAWRPRRARWGLGRCLRPRCSWLDPVPVHALAVRGAGPGSGSPSRGGQVAVGETQDDGFFGAQRAVAQAAEERRQSGTDPGHGGFAVPVPGSPGNLWQGVNDGRVDRIPRWDTIRRMSGRRSGRHRPRQAGGIAARPAGVQDGGGTVRLSWTQLDLMGHDRKPASRWPGTLREYGRHTDRTRYSPGGKWRSSRSSLKKRGRSRGSMCPFSAGSRPGSRHAGSRAGVKVERPAGLWPTLRDLVAGGISGRHQDAFTQ